MVSKASVKLCHAWTVFLFWDDSDVTPILMDSTIKICINDSLDAEASELFPIILCIQFTVSQKVNAKKLYIFDYFITEDFRKWKITSVLLWEKYNWSIWYVMTDFAFLLL